MRLAVGLASLALPPAIALGMLAACGGPAFSTVALDGGSVPVADSAIEAGAGSFCAVEAGAHTFCDDFDTRPLATAWQTIQTNGGASAVSTDTSVSVSHPGSLKSATDPSPPLSTFHARVLQPFGVASRVVVAFELHIDATGPKPLTGGASFVDVNLGANYTIAISGNSDNVSYTETATPADGGLQQDLSSKGLLATSGIQGTWASVKLDIDVAHATLAITINGTLLLSGAPITPPTGLNATVYIGVRSRNVASPVGAHYDNVTVDVTP